MLRCPSKKFFRLTLFSFYHGGVYSDIKILSEYNDQSIKLIVDVILTRQLINHDNDGDEL